MILSDILSADRELIFACGHSVDVPLDWDKRVANAKDEAGEKFWTDQTIPTSIAAVAACPLCKGVRGKTQLVVAVNARVTLPPEQGRLS